MKKKTLTLGSIVVILLLLAIYFILPSPQPEVAPSASLSEIPAYSGEPFVILEDNMPRFSQEDYVTESYEQYEDLDALNRCTYTMACIGRDLMPTEERGNIGQVKPTGWVTAKYDFVDGKYLYNRCHLIGFQLTGENANAMNLITGTRYMNVDGMLPFENMVADYVKETGNHVLYRVIPIFEGDNLVAGGVTMEAWSVEDNGEGICFYVYVYNVQPGVEIDYATGESWLAEPVADSGEDIKTYVVNTGSGKFHDGACGQAEDIKPENKETFETTRSQMIAWSFEPAGCCKP
ncbi:MAG: DNA/RNA non-specific endonuclease [Oscillospiraceae bacterium]|nr:DNA/RNA non-specific endonuclease [Oscillospiraceae bacterium]